MAVPRSPLPRSGAPDPGRERDIYSVSRLNREVRALLENGFPPLWVEGEVSNLARPASGHLYFSLKDAQAQVRCAMFRSRSGAVGFVPSDGTQVLVRGRIGLYEPRGDYQLIVEYMEPAGEGALRLAFERLKRKLAAEGLFAPERKRPLPKFPATIGVVTSPSGAAIRDVLSVLERRSPQLAVIVYPVPVQGADAAARIRAMLERAAARAECDVLILTRGGGSLEDLWSFNDEALARAIVASPIPIVTGIGHEIDFTIADFAADVRAPTPSAAAELVSVDARALGARVEALAQRVVRALAQHLQRLQFALAGLERRLVHPGRRLEQLAQRVDELGARLALAVRTYLRDRQVDTMALEARLRRENPLATIAALHARASELGLRGAQALRQRLLRDRGRIETLSRALDAVSPLATLGRGYAIVERAADGSIVRNAAAVRTGESIRARLAEGTLHATVIATDTQPAP
jgi:exodeoxyribonuclease VII large subunit